MTGKSNLDLMNYIGGEFVPHSTKEWLDVVEPATGVCYARVPLSNTEDIVAAVKAANLAKREWGSLSLEERSAWLDKIADALESRFEEIASLESRDTGKPIAIARSVDAKRSIANFRFFADLIRGHSEEKFEMSDATNIVVSKPVGVGALITPWNLPLYLLSWKVAPAIGMGNTVV